MLKIEVDEHNIELVTGLALGLLEYVKLIRAPIPSETPVETETSPDEGPADDAMEPPGTAAPVVPSTPTAEPELDEHGVAADLAFVGKATVPFYESGKRKGQWKKKRGVSDIAYSTWYSSQLLEQPINTAAAFDTSIDRIQELPVAAIAPTDAGEFMLWVSEQQTAGNITQADVAAAYAQLNVTINDCMQDASVAVALYEILNK